jgi:hypothetical protein
VAEGVGPEFKPSAAKKKKDNFSSSCQCIVHYIHAMCLYDHNSYIAYQSTTGFSKINVKIKNQMKKI